MRLAALLLACLTAACASAPRQTRGPERPSLVVVLVADQFRADFLDRAAPHLTGGLHRLITEGAWFRDAAYPFLNTVTCTGHSTIGTGALPYNHGMVLNAWWDRATARQRACTSDEQVKNLGFTGNPGGGDSARWMLLPTLAQQLRERTGGRAVALSLKARSAITLAGPGANAVVWFNERAGWTTSTAFAQAPTPWVHEFIARNPVSADSGRVWDRALPPSAYVGPDAGEGEQYPQGWDRTFPHRLASGGGAEFIGQWQRTPFADDYLARMAAAAIDALGLGRGRGTDFLGISFSTMDLTGHQFGPDSHEVQDLVFSLDRTLGSLLAHLDRTVGRGRYVVGFSSDHGVGPLPEQTPGAGRQTGPQALAAIDAALVPFFGPGKYAAHSVYTDLYLLPGVMDRLEGNDEASAAVLNALRALPGVAHAFRSDELTSPAARHATDHARRAAALSHYRSRSGDLIIVPREHWMLSTSSATTHGTLYPYDQRVPVIFLGARVTPGRYTQPATPADIAPTLAALAGFAFTAPDGRALIERHPE